MTIITKTRLAFAMILGLGTTAMSAPPDLTNGGVPGDTISFNLGPTGARGWTYHARENSSESRQILVMQVAAGSPASGILAVNDVILGADGTGAEPVGFSSDARKALANAINDAEARNPATLKLIRWRAGVTSTVNLTLQTLGTYTATAPYNCPKSTLILQRGLQAIMAGETVGRYSFSTLTLLAANNNNPSDPANTARMARAQTEARALIPSAATMTQLMSDARDATSMVTWQRGHTLVVLAEYFLATNDTLVLPAIEAYAVNISKNSSLFGTMGHIFAEKNLDGSANGPMGGQYGPVNSTGITCFLGLLLARECGLANPEITPAIDRMSRFYAYYAGRGSIPYGEHEPYWQGHESNGKSGLAALCFTLQNNRVEEGSFFAKMATAAASERGEGHTGAFFNYTWAPLGAACGGEEAAASHFSRIRWMLDLSRRWDGGFEYDCINGEGPNSGSTYYDFRMSTPALLTYALPLRQIRITGKNHNSGRWLTSTDVAEAAAVDGYVASASLSISQLISDLGSWSPMVQRRAAEQLATRAIDTATLNQITALANDPIGSSRIGACFTLGKISNSTTANARAATLAALLTDPHNHVRFMAAEAMRYLPDSARLTQLNAILSAAASTATPLLPFDEEDPLHFAHGRLAMLLFYGGTAYGPRGVIYGTKINSPTVIDRNLLYPAISAVAANPVGQARGTLTDTYKNLTLADVNALANTLVDSIQFRAPSDKMFSGGIRQGGLFVLEKYNIAEGVPLSKVYMLEDGRTDAYTYGLGVLKNYAGTCTTVTPDPDIIGFCQSQLSGGNAAAAQAVLDAIAADTNPVTAIPFKSIQSATADALSINLPANQTTLHASASDLAQGASVYTWRKVHGAGNVTFTPNGTAAAKDSVIQFNNVPGKYLFEVKMSDSRGFTEVYKTVAVTLRNPDGTLPPNSPPTAIPQTVSAIPGDATPFMLTGTDPENYPLVFNVTAQPAHGTITGTAPNLVYTADISYLGPDSFTFRVMDSEGQTSSATVSINVSTADAQLLVHEPFDYAAGGLNGKGGTSEIGLAGTWSASTSANVVAGSLSYGSLAVTGGSIGNLNTGSNNYGGKRSLNATALAQNGLLNDGSTLWFSVVMGYGTGGNITNSLLAFALSNAGFSTANYQYYILDEGTQLGSGLGVTLGKSSGKVVATQFRNSTYGMSGTTGNVYGNFPASTIGAGQQRLVVGKITWGAVSDTIELYEPDTSLNINLPTSTLTVNVDQSNYDTITWSRGDIVTMDEIRFGDSLAAVVGLNISPPDTTPPALVNIADDRGGETMQQYSPVNYTVTFSEQMNPTTVTAADFSNAGTSAVTIASVTQTLPGVFAVQVTPNTVGTLQLRINAGAVLTDIAGNPLNNTAAITDDTVITVNPAISVVPEVIGLTQSAAEAEITAASLTVGTVTELSNESVPAGSVISQNPAGGSNVSPGSSVDLVISLGQFAGNDFANADIPVSGTVGGSYSNTSASDNSYESITERESGGNPNNRYSYLEHKWAFNVTGGDTVTFHVEARHSANAEGDDFIFAYSTTGVNGTYVNMLTITKTSDDNASQSFVMPTGTSGIVHVRVLDTNRTAGRKVLDTLFIDQMKFHSFINTMSTVPSVVGLAQATAETNITAANLASGTITTQNHATVPVGSVISQNPAGGAIVAQNTAVDLVVSTGPVATAYETWSGGAAFASDSNGDGVDNGMAWLLGAADASANAKLPVASQNAGALVLDFTCLKSAMRGTASMKVQYSRDIGITDSWASHQAAIPDNDINGTVNGVAFVISANANPALINIRATIPASAASPGSTLFGRLVATPN